MDSPTVVSKPKQPLVARMGFFVLGGVLSSTLNWTILNAAMHFFKWSYAQGYACSAASTAVVLFLWSYYINFRTSRVWKNCLGRYLVCWAAALLLNYLIGVSGLKHFGSSRLLQLLVIGVVQSFTGGIKFVLYHFWVFPHADAPEKPPAEVAS